MIRLVVSIVLLLVLAVFVAMNMPYETTINLFGYMFEEVSVVAVVILAMVAGVIYSFGLYLANHFARLKKAKVKQKTASLKQKEHDLDIQEKKVAMAKSDETGSDASIERETSDRSQRRKTKKERK